MHIPAIINVASNTRRISHIRKPDFSDGSSSSVRLRKVSQSV